MTDSLSHPDTGVAPDRGATTGTSRWQKLVGIVGVLVVLWVGNDTYNVIDGDFGGGGGGGGHRPPAGGQHTPPDEDQQPDSDDGGGGHRPPPGGHG